MEVCTTRPKNLEMLYKIGNIMENEEFREFFDEHFEYYDDITSIIMIMKGYQGIQNELSKTHDPTVDEIVQILHTIFTTNDYRSKITKRMISYMSDGKKFFESKNTVASMKPHKMTHDFVITN